MEEENATTEEGRFVSKHEFYFDTPLYEVVELKNLEEHVFVGDVDAYSARNETETTYTISRSDVSVWATQETSWKQVGFYFLTLVCKRKANDILRFFVYKDNNIVLKVGQYPSLADLQFSQIGKKYDKVLPKEDLKNLKKAIGLVSHGAGAGSFVYLRRIFENLIFETFKDNITNLKTSEADFKKQRMEEKVETLKTFLPSHLVEMKSIYGILSKGVHELSEEDCLKYFAPLKLSIELILDQKIEAVKKHERDVLVKKQLQGIHQELGGTGKVTK